MQPASVIFAIVTVGVAITARLAHCDILSCVQLQETVSHISHYPLSQGERVQHALISKVSDVWSPVVVSVVAGIVLGDKDGLRYLSKLFRDTGLSHIAVFSGANMALMISLFERLLQFLKRPYKELVLILCITSVICIVGASPPSVRAFLMAFCSLVFLVFQKKISGIQNLILVGTMMVLIKPELVVSISFHLTMLATFAMISAPKIKKWWSFAHETVRMSMYMALYTIAVFGIWSIRAVIANLIILPSVSLATILSLITLILSLIHPILGQSISFITEILIQTWISIMELIRNIPGELSFTIPKTLVALWYCHLIASYLTQKQTPSLEGVCKHTY